MSITDSANTIRRWYVRRTKVRSVLKKNPSLLDEEKSEEFYWVPMKYKAAWLKVRAGLASDKLEHKMACLKCRNYVRVEVAHCQEVGCEQWAERPYRRKI